MGMVSKMLTTFVVRAANVQNKKVGRAFAVGGASKCGIALVDKPSYSYIDRKTKKS